MKSVSLPLLSLVWIAGWQSSTVAHGVAIEYQATQAYTIQAAYDSGEPMADAQVTVFSPADPAKPWLKGTTDAAGRFVFSPSLPGNWEVQVRRAGHGDIVTIPVADATAAAPPATTPPVASGAIARYTPLQKGLMIGAIVWGCVGTALFFMRGKKRVESNAHS